MLYRKEMAFGTLSQNEVSRSLIPKIGLKAPYIPTSLASWWDIFIIKIFCLISMGLGTLMMLNNRKQGLYHQNSSSWDHKLWTLNVLWEPLECFRKNG